MTVSWRPKTTKEQRDWSSLWSKVNLEQYPWEWLGEPVQKDWSQSLGMVDFPQSNLPVERDEHEVYEMPKVWAEQGMEKFGEAVSKVPVLPKALEFVAPAFEWIHKELELPWASIITSPWAPELPWKPGESWIDHQKREYQAWKAPTYIKGAAEFSMPLWWVPYFGWASRGAKALATGAKISRATVPKALAGGKLAIPSRKALNDTLYKGDFLRKVANWAEDKPILHQVVKRVGGESAFVRNIGDVYPAMDIATRKLVAVTGLNKQVPLTDVIRRELVTGAKFYDMRHGYRGLQLTRMQQYGKPEAILRVDEFGMVQAATPKKGYESLGKGLSEVFENPEAYKFETKAAQNIVKEGNNILRELRELAIEEGLERIPKKPMFHRMVKGIAKDIERKGDIEEDILRFGNIENRAAQSVRGQIPWEGVPLTNAAEAQQMASLAERITYETAINARVLHPTTGKLVPSGVVPTARGATIALNKELIKKTSIADLIKSAPELVGKISAADFGHSKKKFIEFLLEHEREHLRIAARGLKYPARIEEELVTSRALSKVLPEKVKSTALPEPDKAVYEASEYGSKFEAQRHYKTMQEALDQYAKTGRRIVYETDPLKSIGATVDHYFKRIATKRFDDEVRKFGFSIPEWVMRIEPDLMENIAFHAGRAGSASYALQTLTRLSGYGGKYIPGGTMAKIRKGLPEVAERIEQAFSVRPKEIDRIINAMGRDIIRTTKMNPRTFKIMLAQYMRSNERLLGREIDDFVRSLNVNDRIATKAITKAYNEVYRSRKQFIDDTLKAAKNEAETILNTSKRELSPLRQQYRSITRELREGRELLGENMAKYQMHPAFRNILFDKDAVMKTEGLLRNQGHEWLRNMATVSGTGRMLIAALDFSAPFIQGLGYLGFSPVGWAGAVGKQFGFFAKPQNLYKYLNDPAIRAVAADRWFYGGSRSTFEFFQALEPLQRLIGKVPKVGRLGQKAVGQTYGRAEAAFTGFGEVARNNLWLALKRPNMTEAELRGLARTIDRMTGVMSTDALVIGRSQTDFENAFVFFAPRYTRAGLTFTSEVMRGGLGGAQARKALGALAGGGMAMYYGISTVLGQQPHLDPRSAKFMTVRIGDDRVGIGGILYGLARFGMNLTATAAEDPQLLNPANLSRFDNPFYKFMFSRTAPLTGALTGMIEQKNFFGEPLEGIGDWGKFMAEKVLPIAMQRAILEPEHRNPAVFASEIMGGRTFPQSPWELQDKARDALAWERHGLPYEQLDKLQQRRIDNEPQVVRFQQEIDESTTRRGEALSVAFLERRRELDDARMMHKLGVEQLANAYDKGLISGYDFKEEVFNLNQGYGATYEHINTRPRYKEVLKKLEEPSDVVPEYLWEVAYDELMAGITSAEMEDPETGLFDFDAYEKLLERIRAKYGEEAFRRAMEMRNQKYAEYPKLFQELEKAKEVLQPYWDVRTKVEQLFGKQFAESRAGQRLITKRRQAIRATNPEMQYYYNLFYTR